MAKKVQKKKQEFSKLILIIVSTVTMIVTGFTMGAVIYTGDTSPLGYLIPAIYAELATATGFYFNKAKTENKIKLAKKYGEEYLVHFKDEIETETL